MTGKRDVTSAIVALNRRMVTARLGVVINA